jgi:DNA-binding CsgD family transcriptional regulator
MVRKEQNTTVSRLTQREREIFIGVARGLTSSQIGQQLGISRRTVDHRRTSIRQKLGTCEGTRRHRWYGIAQREGWLTDPNQAPRARKAAPRTRQQFDAYGEPLDPMVERICAKWGLLALKF